MRPRLVQFFEGLLGTGCFVPDYSLLFAAAIVLGCAATIGEAERAGVDRGRVFRASIVTIVAALIGSRLYFVVQYAGYYAQHPGEAFLLRSGGSASMGAYLGGFAAAVAAARWQRLSVPALLDCGAPATALAICLGRIGCLLNGCDYGTISALPWAMRFPVNSGPYLEHFGKGLITAGDLSLPVHPTQLYEAAYAVGIFLVLRSYRARKRHPGELFALLFVLYPLGRFLNEFLRGDPGRGALWLLSVPQVFCAAATGCAGWFLLVKRRRVKREAAAVGPLRGPGCNSATCIPRP